MAICTANKDANFLICNCNEISTSLCWLVSRANDWSMDQFLVRMRITLSEMNFNWGRVQDLRVLFIVSESNRGGKEKLHRTSWPAHKWLPRWFDLISFDSAIASTAWHVIIKCMWSLVRGVWLYSGRLPWKYTADSWGWTDLDMEQVSYFTNAILIPKWSTKCTPLYIAI